MGNIEYSGLGWYRVQAGAAMGEGEGILQSPGHRRSTSTPADRDEAAILRDAVGGEPKAIRVLLDVHMPTVHGFVRARVGSRAHVVDDLMQETLEEVIRSAHTFRGESPLATWLCAIARRRLARFYERERRAEEAGRLLIAVPSPPDGEVDGKEEVRWALGTLPATQRQAIVLKYLDDLSVAHVAEQMGKTEVQVQNLLQRGRDGLKKVLAKVE